MLAVVVELPRGAEVVSVPATVSARRVGVTWRPTGATWRRKKPRSDRSHCGACTYGGGRIRTFEDRSRQIYSLLPLTAWLLHRHVPNTPLGRQRTRDRRELTARIELATA